jgi:CheY-like chemotaxis protein
MRFHARALPTVGEIQLEAAVRFAGKRILVIDDDPEVADALSEVLQFLDMRPEVAVGAEGARRALHAGHFDAILSDIAMPLESGTEFMRWLRTQAEPRLRDIPAVAVSACATDRDRHEAFSAGFVAFVRKPFGIGEIVSALSQLFSR